MGVKKKLYAEIVLVTVVSLVCARLWIDYVKYTLKSLFGPLENNRLILFLTAAAFTILAIYMLKLLFADREKDDEEENMV